MSTYRTTFGIWMRMLYEVWHVPCAQITPIYFDFMSFSTKPKHQIEHVLILVHVRL